MSNLNENQEKLKNSIITNENNNMQSKNEQIK